MTPITNGTLVKSTNKADLFRMPDGSVVKHYLTKNAQARVLQDKASLEHIQNVFGQVHFREWDYRIVKTLWFDCSEALVCMEDVPGCVVADLDHSMLRKAEYHAGVWLALYHDRVLKDGSVGYIYTDFTVHNLIVDFDNQSVVAIDPGAIWQRQGNAYEDVTKHIHSVIFGLVVKRFASPSVLFNFVRGYATTSKVRFNLRRYIHGVLRELTRQFLDYGKTSLPRFAAFPLWAAALSPLYFVVVPAYLLHVSNGRRATL